MASFFNRNYVVFALENALDKGCAAHVAERRSHSSQNDIVVSLRKRRPDVTVPVG